MKKIIVIYSILAGAALFTSCDNPAGNHDLKPIVLGDSAFIVTETDSQYLGDNVEDLEYGKRVQVRTGAAGADTATALPPASRQAADTPVKKDVQAASPIASGGHSIAIGNGSSLVIDGVKLKEFKAQDGTVANDLDYLITSGKYNQAVIRLDKGKISKVSYRYQSGVLYTINNTALKLSSVGNYTSDWEPVSFKGNEIGVPKVANVKPGSATAAQLKTAVQKELQSRKYKSSVVQSEVNKIGSRSKPTQAPFSTDITGITLKIAGTDAKGKSFEKNIKLEM